MPLKSLLPMVEPNDLVIGGWDINRTNLEIDLMGDGRCCDPAIWCAVHDGVVVRIAGPDAASLARDERRVHLKRMLPQPQEANASEEEN